MTISPEFVVHLAQYSHLEEVNLRLLAIGVELCTTEINNLEVGAITPLPNLRQLYFDLHAVIDDLHLYPLLTPAIHYIISAAAQLASRMALGIISLRPTPLQADDVARLLFNPGRDLSNVEIIFRTGGFYRDVLDIFFEADTGDSREIGMLKSFRLEAVIMPTELVGVADVIFDLFPLEDHIHRVNFDHEALIVAEVAKERSPDAAGLQYLLRCAAATANRSDSARESSDPDASDESGAFR